MRKLAAVEEAKALMAEAREWPVWRWLMEKGRVRAAADRATDALAAREKRVKAAWPEQLKAAYGALGQAGRVRGLDTQVRDAAQKVKRADEAAEASRLDAEATFDLAEQRLSASLAREGTQKAIESWKLREKAIRQAEAAAAPGAAQSSGA